MSRRKADPALLNARYVAIRTAETRGLTDRLLEASRDKTPGVRRLLAPLLYRYWRRNRGQGWELIERIAESAIRFPGLLDRSSVQLVGEISMPILNDLRQEPEELARLAAIWHGMMSRLFGTPLAKTARVLVRGGVAQKAANLLADVLKRQPIYQPINYREMETTFARPEAFRSQWREALACLEQPARAPGPIMAILMRADLDFDLYLMMICERALIYYGAQTDPAGAVDLMVALFERGAGWFRQSILYVLLHVLSFLPEVEDRALERYEALTLEFFRKGWWRLETAAGRYESATHLANPDVVAGRHRPGRPPRLVPALLEEAIAGGKEAEVRALFSAIDGVAFYHGDTALALQMIERAQALSRSLAGAEKRPLRELVERRVIASLATVRLLDQPGVDDFLERHGSFAGTSPEQIAASEPSVAEEDLVTLLDGFIIHMMLTSDAFRAQICGAFSRALKAGSVAEFLGQILEWVRDGLAGMRSR